MAEVVMIFGGVRSGKSAVAERMALTGCAQPVLIATARMDESDPEMAARIARHKASRSEVWQLVEEPLELAGAVLNYGGAAQVCLIDCMTVWLANIMTDGLDFEHELAQFVDALVNSRGRVILVSNELGLGGVAMDPVTRRFADAHGQMNQALAALANRVVMVVAGVAVTIKEA